MDHTPGKQSRTPCRRRYLALPALLGGLLLLSGCLPNSLRTSATVQQELLPTNADRPTLVSEVSRVNSITDTDGEDEHHDAGVFDLPDTEDSTVWSAIHNGFGLPDHRDHPRVQDELRWFDRHHGYMDRVMQRSEPFLYFILREIEQRGLPTELVLLPVVESAFQPFAYSHGRAAGLWQFIPATGRVYGLEQNWWYDGRRDIHASTHAALDYLEDLAAQFDHDWLLALAAYNSGAGTVRKAIRKNRRKHKATDFWALDLPGETRAYVPRLLALKTMISKPTDYGFSLRCIPYAPGFTTVDAGSQIDLATAAELAGIDLDTLYRYNPGYNRWATAPDGPHQLLLPVESAGRFVQALSQLPEEHRLRWQRHKVSEGETLGHIAERYRTTIKHLQQANGLEDHRIRSGKHLLIPVSSREFGDYRLSAGERRSRRSKSPPGVKQLVHTVSEGESFWLIARRYRVDMHQLASWNAMAVRDPLREGKKLVIRKPGTGVTTGSTNNPRDARLQSISYTVRSGDSLSQIAHRYRVSINDLHRWNRIEGRYLQPGQRLRLYIDVTEQSAGHG